MKHAMQLTALSLAIAVVGATDVAARKGPGMVSISFEDLDADGNGEVTKAELDAHRTDRFATLDANADGSVTKEELQAHIEARAGANAERMMERLDKDGDGALSEAEMEHPKRKGGDRMFSRLDKDGNGSLNKEEFEAARDRMRHGRWHRKGGHDE